MTATLFRDGRVRTPDRPGTTALLVRGGAIAWLGDDPDSVVAEADEQVDLGGALVAPAFVDAHVHATSTGEALTGLDLTGTTSLADALARVAAASRRVRGDVLVGHGWDETTWPERRPPTRGELDRAAAGGVVYLSRVDVHSAVVSSALVAAVPEVRAADGWDESGHISREAHHLVRRVSRESMSPARRRALQRAALAEAARHGIALVHELSGPDIAGAADLAELLELARDTTGPEVIGYWGELDGTGVARDLGALGAAGDLFADGSIGSHTASLREPYADAGHSGHGYLDASAVRDHVVACTEAGLQAGFHAIGDAALDAVVGGFAEAAERVGPDRVRAARHRIEHVEMVAPEHLPVLARLGIVVSAQPAFDLLWGGKSGMYAERLGIPRALTLNPFAAMRAAGITLAFGSDSPVTTIDPWGAVRAAVHHHTDGSGLDAETAFTAHTVGGWLAAGRDADGVLVVGAPATFAVWDAQRLDAATGLPDLAPDLDLPGCLRTVVRGETIYDVDG